MADKLKTLLPTDIISDSIEKINKNFEIVLSANSMQNFSLSAVEKKFQEYIDNIVIEGYKNADNELFDKISLILNDFKENISSIIKGDEDNDEISATLKLLSDKTYDFEKALAELSAKIDGVDGLIESKLTLLATKDELKGVKTSLSQLSSTISGLDDLIESKLTSYVKQDEINGLKESIAELEAAITGDDTDISALLGGYVKQDEFESWAQTNMISAIDDHIASVTTLVHKDENGNIDSSVKITADNIDLSSKSLSLNTGQFTINTDNFKLDENGSLYVGSDITTKQLIAESDRRITTITPDAFEISSNDEENKSSISISLVDMNTIDGITDAPSELQNATSIPTLCMTYKGQSYYLWPGAWKSKSSDFRQILACTDMVYLMCNISDDNQKSEYNTFIESSNKHDSAFITKYIENTKPFRYFNDNQYVYTISKGENYDTSEDMDYNKFIGKKYLQYPYNSSVGFSTKDIDGSFTGDGDEAEYYFNKSLKSGVTIFDDNYRIINISTINENIKSDEGDALERRISDLDTYASGLLYQFNNNSSNINNSDYVTSYSIYTTTISILDNNMTVIANISAKEHTFKLRKDLGAGGAGPEFTVSGYVFEKSDTGWDKIQ